MRKSRKAYGILFAAAGLISPSSRLHAAVFASTGDLIIVQTNGDGNGGGDSVSLLDMTVSGNSVSMAGTINLPTSTLTYNGSAAGLVLPDSSSVVSASHAGQITLSQDGHSLEMGAYLAPVGTVSYFGTPYSPNGVSPGISPRVITVIGSTGGVSEAATLTGASDYSSVDIRQVTSLNGTQFWSTGNGAKPYGSTTPDIGGLRYSTSGSTSTTSLNLEGGIDIRTTAIYQGQLYGAGGSNNSPPGEHTLSQLGTGLQTLSAPAWTPLPAIGGGFANGDILGNQSPSFLTLNNGVSVLYQSDSTTGGLEKWALTNGRWKYDGEIAFGKDAIENVAARLNSDGSVSIYADNNTGTNGVGNVYGFTDTSGAGEMTLSGLTYSTDSNGNHVYLPGTPIYTAPAGTTNLQFWGLSFAPSSSKAVENQIWGNLDGATGAAGGSWNTAGNWAGGAAANASGSTATFGPGLTTSGVITLDGSKTVGHLVFNDAAANYTLSAGNGGTLTIDNTDPNSSGVPSIFNSNGSQTISVPISLANGVTIADHYQASMVISSAISGSGAVQVFGPGTLTLSGPSTYSGATTVHSGAVTIAASGSLPATTNLTVGDITDTDAVGTSASVLFNASTGTTIRPITLASLSLVSNGTLTLAKSALTSNRSVLVVGGLSFAGSTGAWGGLLDLGNNDAIIHNGSLATIQNQLTQGYDKGGGLWQGSAGIVSSTAASTSVPLTTLGVIQNSVNQTTGGSAIYSTFDGQTAVSSDVLVKYTYYGDANLDGRVDGSDYALIDNGFNSHATGWINGDFNYDGVVDGSDYTLIDNAYLSQGTAITSELANATSQVAGVPEPSMLLLPLIAAITARRRAREVG